MNAKLNVNAVPVLVEACNAGTVSKLIFSPGKPLSAILLYENSPPEVHDLRVAGLTDSMPDGAVVELNARSRIDSLKFRDPARAAAYRPGHDELALAFGEGDCFIHRCSAIRARKLEAIYFENPVCLSYSRDGELLAAGSSDGTVSIFRLEDEDAVELRTVSLPAAARSIGFDELSNLLIVSTENNALIEFAINSDEDVPVARGVELENGQKFVSMQINSLAYGEDGVVAYAGVGNEIWMATSLARVGGVASMRAATRVYDLQFVESQSVIVALTDAGVQILGFEMNDERRPVFGSKVVHYRPISPRMPMIGCRHYGNMICIASLLPSEN